MTRSLFAFAFLSICACAARVGSFAVAAIDRGVRFVFETLASAPRFVIPTFEPATAGGPLAYDGPPIHALRHEAGTSRRAAERNI